VVSGVLDVSLYVVYDVVEVGL